MHDDARRPVLGYVVAGLAVAGALLARFLLDSLLGDHLPFVTFFVAVVIASWYGGLGSGLLATALGFLLALYFFVPPRWSFFGTTGPHLVGLAMYFLVSLAIAAFSEAMRAARRRSRQDRVAAQEQREWLRTTLASIGDAVITTDAGGRVTLVNGVAQELTGWTQGDAAGLPLEDVFKILNEQTRQPVEGPVQRVLREGRVVGLANHTVLIRKDGTERPIDDSAAPIRDAAGRITGVVLIFRDITERRRLERQSAERAAAARLLASVVESSDDAIVSKSLDGTIQTWNAAAERLFGYGAERAVGRHISLIIPADRAEEEGQIIARIRAGERVEHFDTVRVRSDGRPVHVSLTISPVRDEAGRIVGASTIARDVTERKRVEQALRESEGRLRLFIENAPAGIAMFDRDMRYLAVSRRWLADYRLEDREVIGRSHYEVFPEIPDRWREVHRRGLNGEVLKAEEDPFERADGSTQWLRWEVRPWHADDGAIGGIIILAEEITARKQAEQALRESEARFRTLADSAPVLIWVNGATGCEYVNRSYLDFLGLTMEQVRGMSWADYLHPDDAEGYVSRYLRALEGRSGFEAQLRFRRADGQYRWLKSVGVPRFTPGGEFLGYIGSSVDITEIKHSEESLKEADRRKDQFVMMLAHELRNPLAPIRNGLQLLQASPHGGPAVEQARAMMARQVGHMARIIEDLLDVSRLMRGRVELRPERLDLGQLARTALEDQREAFGRAGLSVDADLPELPVWVEGDPTRLTQVLDNLLQNAVKFTDRGGEVTVRVQADPGRRQAVLTVRDTGVGIEPGLLPHLFETFTQADRSLDRSKGGLGLGLSLVKGLVELHGGTAEARSEGPGRGAEFVVRLPLQPEPAAITRMPDAPRRAGGKLRVLVVEDNRDAADSLRMLLQLYGYDVTVAYTGPAGVETAKDWRPDVVLCDIGLPGLSGYEVARALRQDPATAKARMIAVTGYGGDEDRLRSRQAGFDGHLTKPADPAALQEMLVASRGC